MGWNVAKNHFTKKNHKFKVKIANNFIDLSEGNEEKIKKEILDQTNNIKKFNELKSQKIVEKQSHMKSLNFEIKTIKEEIKDCKNKIHEAEVIVEDAMAKSGVVRSEVQNFFKTQTGVEQMIGSQEIAAISMKKQLESVMNVIFSIFTDKGKERSFNDILGEKGLSEYAKALDDMGFANLQDCDLTTESYKEFISEFMDLLKEDYEELLRNGKIVFKIRQKLKKLLTGQFTVEIEKDKKARKDHLLQLLTGFPDFLINTSAQLRITSDNQQKLLSIKVNN